MSHIIEHIAINLSNIFLHNFVTKSVKSLSVIIKCGHPLSNHDKNVNLHNSTIPKSSSLNLSTLSDILDAIYGMVL